MKVTLFGITIAIFIFLLLLVLLQNRVTPPSPPPLQATFEAVSDEATRASGQATHITAERQIVATTEAIQLELSNVQTQTAKEMGAPLASPIP